MRPIEPLMNPHLRAIRRLIDDGMYVVDSQSVATAILSRAYAHQTVARASFRSDLKAPSVRSFRRDEHARSFRLERGVRLRQAR